MAFRCGGIYVHCNSYCTVTKVGPSLRSGFWVNGGPVIAPGGEAYRLQWVMPSGAVIALSEDDGRAPDIAERR